MDASDSTKQNDIESASAVTIGVERALQLLSQGNIELVGQILASSNVIFLTRVENEGLQALAIYKPYRGERPLWDFPQGTLHLREIAAHAVSQRVHG